MTETLLCVALVALCGGVWFCCLKLRALKRRVGHVETYCDNTRDFSRQDAGEMQAKHFALLEAQTKLENRVAAHEDALRLVVTWRKEGYVARKLD